MADQPSQALMFGDEYRQAYDGLQAERGLWADHKYVRLLHLAANTSESKVETVGPL